MVAVRGGSGGTEMVTHRTGRPAKPGRMSQGSGYKCTCLFRTLAITPLVLVVVAIVAGILLRCDDVRDGVQLVLQVCIVLLKLIDLVQQGLLRPAITICHEYSPFGGHPEGTHEEQIAIFITPVHLSPCGRHVIVCLRPIPGTGQE
jgi:hypothetical protein